MALDRAGISATEFADSVDLSPNAVLKWIRGETFPRSKMWGLIKSRLGIDPQSYVDYSETTNTQTVTSPTNSPTIIANGSTVTSTVSSERRGVIFELDEDESEILEMFRMIPARERAAVLRDCRKTLVSTINRVAKREAGYE